MISHSLRERRAFVDTSAFHALTDSRDMHHTDANTLRARLIDEQWRLFTTNLVLAETHALVLARLGRSTALRVLQAIDSSNTTIVRVSTQDERRAREILVQFQDKDFSLTDAISFAVIERLRIPFAFAFDRHFLQYGLTVLTSSQP